jgi:hypothetical protein
MGRLDHVYPLWLGDFGETAGIYPLPFEVVTHFEGL